MVLKKYRVCINAGQELIVEAKSAEEARMKVVDGNVNSIKTWSCEEMNVDVVISDAEEVK